MMTLCDPHWDKLKTKIKEHKLYHLVAPNGEVAVEQMYDQIKQKQLTPTNFDPLMGAYWAIMTNGIDILGPTLLLEEGCIICLLNTYRTEDGRCVCGQPECAKSNPGDIPNFEEWLDYAADGQLEYAQENGLMQNG